MPSDLEEALGPQLADRVATASPSAQASVAVALADEALRRAGLDVAVTDELAERLDTRYFDLHEADDPRWEEAFSQARAASSALAAQRGDVGRAAYEAKHSGLPEADLVGIAERAL